MRTIFAEYNPKRNSIDVYTSVGYMLRIDCSPTAKDCIKCRPKCVPRSPAASRVHAKLYLDGTMQIWVDAEDSLELW